MSTKKKLLQAAAGSAGGAGANDVEDIFSTYLYNGNGSTVTVQNNIDLDGDGGMVWIKDRNVGNTGNGWHMLHDTLRGTTAMLHTNETNAEFSDGSRGIRSYNSDGFEVNEPFHGTTSGSKYASWTFKKTENFFTMVEYTGNGTSQTIPHDLGGEVGFITVKCTSANGKNWSTYHRSLGTSKIMFLNLTQNQVTNSNFFTSVTSSSFSVGSDADVNQSGQTYIAYIWAHHDGTGTFGENGDLDVIKCGYYNGTGSTDVYVDLGFEPQWLMVKRFDNSTQLPQYNSWIMMDSMRSLSGMPDEEADGYNHMLRANDYYPEGARGDPNTNATNSDQFLAFENGFVAPGTGRVEFNRDSNAQYLYVAIRRGTKVYTNPDDLFEIRQISRTGNLTTSFVTDFILQKDRFNNPAAYDPSWAHSTRLTGSEFMEIDSTNTASNGSIFGDWDRDQFTVGGGSDLGYWAPDIWTWKRAPYFYDQIAYEGTGSGDRLFQHNVLQTAPEMIWLKHRGGISDFYDSSWVVWHKDFGHGGGFLKLNQTGGLGNVGQGITPVHSFAPNGIDFYIRGGSSGEYNKDEADYIMHLFATLAGVSKVGSYTGNGTSQTIDCGFTSGAQFVLIKRTDGAGAWAVFDAYRGINAGNDPKLQLNSTTVEDSSADHIDTHSSGFVINEDANNGSFNASGANYIFYAIAN